MSRVLIGEWELRGSVRVLLRGNKLYHTENKDYFPFQCLLSFKEKVVELYESVLPCSGINERTEDMLERRFVFIDR
jgi:hypothetical protein